MQIILFFISVIASTIGSISGIGGGIIIKPILDLIGTMSPGTINFLSGCTVLSMALSSFIRSSQTSCQNNYRSTIYLTIGACIGGTIGKLLFASLLIGIELTQSVLLLLINLFVLAYCYNKHKIKTHSVSDCSACILIGFLLGGVSSFLGIGGGPINIAVLSYFFSTSPKITARNSLFIILLSQLSTLATTLVTNTIPAFNPTSLFLMCIGGVSGAIIGTRIATIFDDKKTELFFLIVLIMLIFLNVYNLYIVLTICYP